MASPHIGPSFAPETQLLCLCARPDLDPNDEGRLRALVESPLDWDAVLERSAFHGVTGMVYHCLARSAVGTVPGAVLAELRRRAQGTQFYNLRVMGELIRIAALFRARDIPVLAYKGPTLAHRYYGSVALRRFGDVDLLVPRTDIGRAEALLHDDGYSTLRALSASQEQTWHDDQLGYELYHPERGVLVELHWALLNRTLTFRLSPETVWARADELPLGSSSIGVLAPDDLLLYLCAHGTKHHWSRLLWVCDVARVLRAHPERDWAALTRRAQSLGSLRTLFLGVALAARWLGVDVPPAIRARVKADAAVDGLIDDVEARWFGTEEGLHRPVCWATFRFAYRTRQRLRDNLPLLWHYLELAVTPNEHDYSVVQLPERLHGLYYLIRPVRMLWTGVVHVTRSLRGSPIPPARHVS